MWLKRLGAYTMQQGNAKTAVVWLEGDGKAEESWGRGPTWAINFLAGKSSV